MAIMNDRLITLFSGLLALALVVILLIRPTSTERGGISRPITTDAGTAGLLGLLSWLEQAGLHVVSFREHYDVLLADQEFPATGNLMILSLPQRQPARFQEREFLRQWVQQGNSLLILAAMNDAPQWSSPNFLHQEGQEGNPKIFGKFELLSDFGFHFESDPLSDSQQPSNSDSSEDKPGFLDIFEPVKPKTRELHPSLSHPVLQGIERVVVSDFPGWPPMRLHPDNPHRTTFVLLHEMETRAAALWQIPLGNGTVWVSRYADVVGNVSLGQGDNARLIANLITVSLGPQGLVLFDDMHQGLSALYDPKAFFEDPRVHHTMWFIIALWLFYIFGRSNRLAPIIPKPPIPQAADFVRSTGGLIAQHVRPGVLGQEIVGNFFNDIRRLNHLPLNKQPTWELLFAAPRVKSQKVKALRHLVSRLPQARYQDLIHLTNLIRHIRERLT